LPPDILHPAAIASGIVFGEAMHRCKNTSSWHSLVRVRNS